LFISKKLFDSFEGRAKRPRGGGEWENTEFAVPVHKVIVECMEVLLKRSKNPLRSDLVSHPLSVLTVEWGAMGILAFRDKFVTVFGCDAETGNCRCRKTPAMSLAKLLASETGVGERFIRLSDPNPVPCHWAGEALCSEREEP